MAETMETTTKRKEMIKKLAVAGHLKTQRIIDAFDKVPRHLFLFSRDKEYAYSDCPLPIGPGSTISAPHMVADMLELLNPQQGEHILEVGSGSGWNAALLAYLVGDSGFVYSIDIDQNMVDFAKSNMKKTRYKNVEIMQGDGSEGYKNGGTYNKIIFTVAIPSVSTSVFSQLKLGGKIVAPIGSGNRQELTVFTKNRDSTIEKKIYGLCSFVQLRSE